MCLIHFWWDYVLNTDLNLTLFLTVFWINLYQKYVSLGTGGGDKNTVETVAVLIAFKNCGHILKYIRMC